MLLLPHHRHPKLFKQRAERLAQLSRPDVLLILEKIPEVLREALAWKYGDSSVVYVPKPLHGKVEELSEIISLATVEQVKREFVSARNEVGQNANVKIVFFDLLLNIAMIYVRR